MTSGKDLNEVISSTEYNLAKYKFLKEKFTDLKVKNALSKRECYCSKSVNTTYTNLEFLMFNRTLYARPYLEVCFNYSNKSENIKIFSLPTNCSLVYIDGFSHNRKIKFSRLKNNLKNNNLKNDMLKDCYFEIVKFITQYSNIPLDTKYLDPQLKKLLAFL